MLTPAARANKLFGNNGGLALTLQPAFPNDFDTNTPLFVRIDGLDVPLWCDNFERRGQTGALVRFADIDIELRAAELIGQTLYIDLREEDEPDDDDQFYMEDLIGFSAEGNELSGEVTDYYDSEANPLFEVTTADGQTVLIPAAEEFIAQIDFESHTMRFLLPEGLVELNAKHDTTK